MSRFLTTHQRTQGLEDKDMIKTAFGVNVTVLVFSITVIAIMHFALSQYRAAEIANIDLPDYTTITSSISR
jgi:hypothetical protein